MQSYDPWGQATRRRRVADAGPRTRNSQGWVDRSERSNGANEPGVGLQYLQQRYDDPVAAAARDLPWHVTGFPPVAIVLQNAGLPSTVMHRGEGLGTWSGYKKRDFLPAAVLDAATIAAIAPLGADIVPALREAGAAAESLSGSNDATEEFLENICDIIPG